MRQLIILSFLFLFSCANYHSNSLLSLYNAFNEWYLIQKPDYSNSLMPHNYYVKNNNMNSGYLNEYIFDLKRFKLELMQINKNKLNKKNLYKYNSISDKIDFLIFEHEYYRYYQYDPSYYFEIINNHLLDLLTDNSITSFNKNDFIIETLNLIPNFLNKISKNIIISNDFFIEKSNLELDKTIEILNNIPIYVKSDDNTLKTIESKIEVSKKYLMECSNWLSNDLNNNLSIDNNEFANIYNNQLLSIEKKYKHDDLLNSLDLTIKNLQNNIFNLSLPIYLEENDEPIWLDRQDTLDVISYVIKNNLSSKNIQLDNTSKIIDFKAHYDSVLSFIDLNISKINKFDNIYFADYNMFFENDEPVFLANDSYSKANIQVLFNNSYQHIHDNEIYSFIINDILVKHMFNLYMDDNSSSLYNNINHYVWGKLLSKIIIQYDPSFLDSDFEIYENIKLLGDLVMLSVKYQYINGSINEKEALDILHEEIFIDSHNVLNNTLRGALYDNNFNLEYYAAYIELMNLYDTHCIIENKISAKKMIQKIFKYGFIPVYNYKSILN